MKKEINARAGAIVYHNNNILLMYRQKNSKTYYTFPGGTVEPNETIEAAVIRELFEETSVIAKQERLLYHLRVTDIPLVNSKKEFSSKDDFFFLCKYISGDPSLSINSIEFQRANSNNFYKPVWVPLKEVKNLLLYPLEIKDLIINDLESGFSPDIKKIDVSYNKLRHQ